MKTREEDKWDVVGGQSSLVLTRVESPEFLITHHLLPFFPSPQFYIKDKPKYHSTHLLLSRQISKNNLFFILYLMPEAKWGPFVSHLISNVVLHIPIKFLKTQMFAIDVRPEFQFDSSPPRERWICPDETAWSIRVCFWWSSLNMKHELTGAIKMSPFVSHAHSWCLPAEI